MAQLYAINDFEALNEFFGSVTHAVPNFGGSYRLGESVPDVTTSDPQAPASFLRWTWAYQDMNGSDEVVMTMAPQAEPCRTMAVEIAVSVDNTGANAVRVGLDLLDNVYQRILETVAGVNPIAGLQFTPQTASVSPLTPTDGALIEHRMIVQASGEPT